MIFFGENNFLGKFIDKGIGGYTNFNEFPNHKKWLGNSDWI